MFAPPNKVLTSVSQVTEEMPVNKQSTGDGADKQKGGDPPAHQQAVHRRRREGSWASIADIFPKKNKNAPSFMLCIIVLMSCFAGLVSFSMVSHILAIKPLMQNNNSMQIQLAPSKESIPKNPSDEIILDYLAKSKPIILPGGSVMVRGHYLEIGGKECFGPICSEEPDDFVHIEGNIIASQISHHFFHFVYETVLQLWGLHLHGVLDKYPNSTFIWFGHGSGETLPNKRNIEMLKAIWPEFPMEKWIAGRKDLTYKVAHPSMMVVTRHNDYHEKKAWQPYNFWLLNSIRKTLQIVDEPNDELFISRKGIRRGIAREDELYAALKSSILPNLRRVLPDDFSVAEQTRQFANAKLIIAPHGASLTNTIFSNWDKIVLIELSKARNGGFATYRNDLQVKEHYLLKCQSAPCPGNTTHCDPWDTAIDVNVENATETIKNILSGGHSWKDQIFISGE